jgi:hypothetical protein
MLYNLEMIDYKSQYDRSQIEVAKLKNDVKKL